MSNIARYRTKAEWEAKNPLLRNGEPGFEEDTGKLKMGDGVSHWKNLAYLNTSPFMLPKVSADEARDLSPGTELAFSEIRSGLNATTTSTTVLQDLSPWGMQVVVEPTKRPYLVRALALLGHSVAGGVVGLRIAEVSNGVDAPLTRAAFLPVPGAAAPFYAPVEAKLRVPVSPRERVFQLLWFNTTAGTATLYAPGSDTGNNFTTTNSHWPLEIQAVLL